MKAPEYMTYDEMVKELEGLRAGRKSIEEHLELQARNQQAHASIRALQMSVRKLAEENEELKAAIRFYADAENYKPRVLEGVDMVIIPVCDDRGEIARAVLGEGKNG